MKSAFSLSWLQSIQPRKQRKYRYNAPQHTQGNFMHAQLEKELQKKHNVRSVRVRSGDKVKVQRGQFKGIEGLVERVDVARERIFVAGAQLEKKDGGKIAYPIHPSKVLITSLKEDKRRFKTQVKK